jgi:hypothetical protein
MIYLNLNLRSPWGGDFKNIKVWHGKTPIPNKYWEVQIIKNDNWLRFEFDFTIQQDHAGINLELGLFKYEIHFTIYDNRHWNYTNNSWEKYEEPNR